MPHVFETEHWVPVPLERVFRFFSDPNNLRVISPPSSGARLQALHLVQPALNGIAGAEHMAGTGSEIVVSFRLLPYLPLRRSWTTRIIEYEWCRHFRDIQTKGPFKSFDHTHSFVHSERNGETGTLIRDHVQYDVGFGPFGIIANAFLVRSMLTQMFTYRQVSTERILVG